MQNLCDLNEDNLEKHCQVFAGLHKAPDICVNDDTDVNILFFKRKDKYFGVRTGLKSDFKSRDQFLVYSILVEKIGARVRSKLSLKNLKVEPCSSDLLETIYQLGNRIDNQLPSVSSVDFSCTVVNISDLDCVYLEDKTQRHCVFWNESESGVFNRCA